MFGLIGDFTARPGRREELMQIIVAGTRDMPGCLSYVVARDRKDPDKFWITELWDNEESHKASVHFPPVAGAIDAAMPLFAQLGKLIETEPVGGMGLPAKRKMTTPA